MGAGEISEIEIGGDPSKWLALGFRCAGSHIQIGSVSLQIRGSSKGIDCWSVVGVEGGDIDGLKTLRPRSLVPGHPGVAHPNGVYAIDHVVVISPDLDRSIEAFVDAGMTLRRTREEPTPAGAPRQAFFKLGTVTLEVVQEPDEALERLGGRDRPARFWGLALKTGDLEYTAEVLHPHVGEIRSAVQQGRRIATVKRSAGLSVPIALMS